MSNRKSNRVERKTRSRNETREAGCAALTGSEWRCVETEPPAFGLPVIVYQPNWKGQPVTLAVYVCRDSSGHKFCFDIQSLEPRRHDHRYSVTHWMPLPTPPNVAVSDEVVGRILRLGYYPVRGQCVGAGAQIVNGEWYMPRWGCDTLQHIIDEWGDEPLAPNEKGQP